MFRRAEAVSEFFIRASMMASLTSLTIQLRISVLPSLFFVWLSKIGFWTLTETAAAIPSRISGAFQAFLKNSLTPLSMPSLKAARWVPPSLVCCPFTYEK